MNFLHSFRNKNKLKLHKKVCENKDFCGATTPRQENMYLEFTQYLESIKSWFFIWADLEFLIKETSRCRNDLGKPSSTKVSDHTPCSNSMSTTREFNDIEKLKSTWKSFVNP